MDIVFYVFLTMAAIYLIFHLKDAFYWWLDKILIVPEAIWNLIKNVFKK